MLYCQYRELILMNSHLLFKTRKLNKMGAAKKKFKIRLKNNGTNIKTCSTIHGAQKTWELNPLVLTIESDWFQGAEGSLCTVWQVKNPKGVVAAWGSLCHPKHRPLISYCQHVLTLVQRFLWHISLRCCLCPDFMLYYFWFLLIFVSKEQQSKAENESQ